MKTTAWQRWYRTVILLCVLAIAWVLWSGLYKPLLLGLGAMSCLLSLYLAHRMGALDRSVFSLHVLPRLPRYWGWLIREIVESSIDVARIVLHPRMPISPVVVDIDAAPHGPVGQAILGNAITLTPGTVTLDIHEGRLKVHCLTREGADALVNGAMNRRAAALTDD